MKLLPAHNRYESHVAKLLGMGLSHGEAELLWNLGHAIAECHRAKIIPTTEAKILMRLAADGVEQVSASRLRQEAQA